MYQFMNSETCVQRNSKGLNFFRCRRVPLNTGNLSMNHRDSKSSICKTVLLRQVSAIPRSLLTEVSLYYEVLTAGVNTQRRNGKSRI